MHRYPGSRFRAQFTTLGASFGQITSLAVESVQVHNFSCVAHHRETVSIHVESIQNALQDRGFDIDLSAGFVKCKETYAYFIYDTDRFADFTAAKAAVSRWLNRIGVRLISESMRLANLGNLSLRWAFRFALCRGWWLAGASLRRRRRVAPLR